MSEKVINVIGVLVFLIIMIGGIMLIDARIVETNNVVEGYGD